MGVRSCKNACETSSTAQSSKLGRDIQIASQLQCSNLSFCILLPRNGVLLYSDLFSVRLFYKEFAQFLEVYNIAYWLKFELGTILDQYLPLLLDLLDRFPKHHKSIIGILFAVLVRTLDCYIVHLCFTL
jgi:hypothetical protein